MEETWQAVFRNLYTGFLLRDFAGKIVPGVYLLFSVASLFRPPTEIIREIKKEVPLFAIVLVAGFAWIVTLGTQRLAEGLGIWKYFPVGGPVVATGAKVGFWTNLFQGGDDASFDASTAKVDLFQVGATEDEKQQYERFVVIKEACGNLFIAGLLSLPAWLLVSLFGTNRRIHGDGTKGAEHAPRRQSPEKAHRVRIISNRVIAGLYFVLIMIGLHRMNAQHVRRQLRYTEIVLENRKNHPETAPKPLAAKTP